MRQNEINRAPINSPAFTGTPIVPTPATGDNSTQIASSAFVQTAINNAIAGVNPAVAVQAATKSASDTSGLTYLNGVSGIGASLTGIANIPLTIDGYTFTAVGQRLLDKDRTTGSNSQRGVYYVTQIQTAILPIVLIRALDYDTPSDINNTGAIPVTNGTDITGNKGTSWILTSQINAVGTDALTYAQFTYSPANARTPVFVRETMGDANKIFSTGYTMVGLNIAITAPRVLTLPASSAFPAGSIVTFVDEFGSVTQTNTITVTRAGSDTINGGTTLILNTAYSQTDFVTDGNSKWTALVNVAFSAGSWNPTITGFSSNPTGAVTRYQLVGTFCNFYIQFTGNGTSNATTKTITLPFAAANTGIQTIAIRAIDNGTSGNGFLVTRLNSNIADVYPSSAEGNWTASGSARFQGSGSYEIA